MSNSKHVPTSAFPSRLPVPADRFAGPLLNWYSANRRALPWRDDPAWYRVWISEIMLQQTTVKAVLPYFEAFLRAFPDVTALAAAREDEVLARWAGLGYYSRARNLQKAAQRICSDHARVFPVDFKSALALPGIGRYTAGAILSIAFGLPFPVLDGNVNRVMVRYLGFTDVWTVGSADALWNLLSALVDEPGIRNRAGDFNQALMELGATVCTPRNPRCPQCPLSGSCQAYRLSLQDSIPQKKRARPLISVDFTVALVRDREVWLMWQSDGGPFPRGLWELPRIAGLPGDDAAERLRRETGLRTEIGPVLGKVIHGITHHRITIRVVEASLLDGALPDGLAWVDPRHSSVGISAYVKKILALVCG